MKKTVFAGLLCLSTTVAAQNFGGMNMNPEQMQQMMQQMQGMQDCMAGIDQHELDAFQQKAEAMDAEVKALCAAGKRDAAMARAMAFGKESAHSKVMQDMTKCGEGMQGMMANLPRSAQPQTENTAPRHVCDP
jgi:hypothetical protein